MNGMNSDRGIYSLYVNTHYHYHYDKFNGFGL